MDIREKVINTFKNKEFLKWRIKAEGYVGDKKKTKALLEAAVEKANTNKLGPIGEIWDKLQLLFSAVRDWMNGSYKDIPTGSIITIIIGIVYFVSPIDIIPDILGPIGFVDDAAVIGFIFKQVSSDLEKYRIWKSNKTIIE